jgi:SHS2 domain-containing protein
MAYRFVEHVGELELELDAQSEAEVFASCLSAFSELTGLGQAGEPACERVELIGDDAALMLVDWLNELVFVAEVRGFVADRVADLELGGGRLCATLEGRRGSPRHLVKAVTLNKLRLEREGGIWHGRVVLDV